ncbi:collagen alpha-1(XII) chain-like [Dreissena polymorpha]|uniref:VWFA domain-containing protein n=1 Tax=Dreissena polymorpha TaxID=45954 RepID=A0A9D4K2S5_DREPO|nr:collagen alpha-1(XII) chain-like [Dreissena polymorpha]KAH3830568.1 hypothetical protein DPMN_103813 [Dreissena polymorpha]
MLVTAVVATFLLVPNILMTSAASTSEECNKTVADIVFILDQSGSVGQDNWDRVARFVINIVNILDIGPNLTKVGIITYNNYPVRNMYLDQYTNKQDLINAIGNLTYSPGATDTDTALDLLRTDGFFGDRSFAPNIAIVITDGYSSNPEQTKVAADKVKNTGTTVFAIGIGSEVQQGELNYISSDPDSSYVFFVANFTSLSSIENSVAKTTCQVPLLLTGSPTTRAPPTTQTTTATTTKTTTQPTTATTQAQTTMTTTTLPTTPPCFAKVADVVFLVDSSGSVGDENFKVVKNFIKNTINVFDIGAQYTRIGVITFSSTPVLRFPLNMYDNKAAILNAIDGIPYSMGGTDTGAALEMLRLQGFRDDRPLDPNIAIVITDGFSRDKLNTARQAQLLKASGNVTIIAIGIGNETDDAELRSIATTDAFNNSQVYHAENFNALQTLNNIVATVACGLVIVTPPPITTPSTVATTSNCFDLEDCTRYGKDDCFDYRPYMTKHCPLFCNVCAGPSTQTPVCRDTTENCAQYGSYICTQANMFIWAKEHCSQYCGFCGNGGLPTEPSTTLSNVPTTPEGCQDRQQNCIQYGGQAMCTDPMYTKWAYNNCREYCGFCSNYELKKGAVLRNNVICPDWHLPKACTLVQNPNDTCCAMPTCPAGYKLSALTPRQIH